MGGVKTKAVAQATNGRLSFFLDFETTLTERRLSVRALGVCLFALFGGTSCLLNPSKLPIDGFIL